MNSTARVAASCSTTSGRGLSISTSWVTPPKWPNALVRDRHPQLAEINLQLRSAPGCRGRADAPWEEVEAMLHLHALGWGMRRIAQELGCSRTTVRRYVAADGWMSYSRLTGGGKLQDQEGG